MLTKHCSKCKLEKAITDFTRCAATKDGWAYRCTPCRHLWPSAKPEIVRARGSQWAKDNPDKQRARVKKWADAHPESRKRYRDENPEKVKESIRRSVNKRKAHYAEKTKRWARLNPEKSAAKSKRYRARFPERARAAAANWRVNQIQATPLWANPEVIIAFYKLAAEISSETGVKHHVDHIVPLKSKVVYGLHCEANLQVIPASANVRKTNKFVPGMPIEVTGDIPCLR